MNDDKNAPTDDGEDREPRPMRPIFSARHLSDAAPELSEFEFGLIISTHAFQRWMVRCMTASGGADFSPLDVLVIHTVLHRDRAKKLADICLVLNVEDSYTVNYSLKKLLKAGLVGRERRGKETYYAVTDEGRALCERYREIREDCLVSSMTMVGSSADEIGRMADFLRGLSGLYDQAARAATSL